MIPEPPPAAGPLIVGRYAIYDRIASGGMATVYIGRLVGPVGFSRTVAIKRLHPQFAADAEFVAMFLDEARLAARIQHPNVVSTLDVVALMGELFLVMDYVRGESVNALLRHLDAIGERMPPRVAAAIASGALQGLHAAHSATDEAGYPLGIVHRDVSPQNILVGVDGTPRVLDFGVAKAENKLHSTRGGEIKGKLLYMPPEQLEGDTVDCTADTYAMGLLLFEMLTGRRMFQKSQDMASIGKILRNEILVPSAIDPSLAAWDPVVRRAAAKTPSERYPSARAMALDVERVEGAASSVEVGDFVDRLAGATIKERAKRIAEIETGSGAAGRALGQAALVEELARSSRGPADVPAPSLDGRQKSETLEPRSEKSVGSAVSHALSVPASGERARRWRPVAIAVAVGILAAALTASFFVGGRTRSPPAVADFEPDVAKPSPSPAASPSPTVSAVAAAPVTENVVAPPAPPPTASPAIAHETSTPASRPRAPAPPKPPSKPNCDHPTTVDGAGHMHFRPECL